MVDVIPKSDARVDLGEALLLAVKDDRKSDLDRLLEKGADPSYRGKRSQTALHEAAFLGRAYCIKELLRVMPELLVEKDRAGQTALHCAAAEGHQSSLEELLGMRQIPREVSLELLSARTYKIGWTALHYAAHNGHAECCRVLMSAAGQAAEFIGAVTDTGRTALHLASVNGHRRCLTVLLRTHMAKQLMTSQSRDGHTAMHLAARFGQPSCVKVLAKKLPELVKVKNLSGHPSLHEAARRGNDKCVETLMALGGASELKASTKQYAETRGHSDIADALVEMENRIKRQQMTRRNTHSMSFSQSLPNIAM